VPRGEGLQQGADQPPCSLQLGLRHSRVLFVVKSADEVPAHEITIKVMATLKQIEANRRNAGFSTGPKTPSGRFRSSLNATKHGAYSKKALTPDENEADLAKLERVYVAHYRPPSELELHDVRQLALLDWRLQRFGRLEAEILTLHGYEREHERGTEGFEYGGAGWGMAHDCSKARAVQAVSQVEHRLRRQFLALKAMLDAQLEERVKAGTLLLPNSLTKLVAASN
jgi:hypothetical protein